jgi:hypothetical protein
MSPHSHNRSRRNFSSDCLTSPPDQAAAQEAFFLRAATALGLRASSKVMKASSPDRQGYRDDSSGAPARRKQKHASPGKITDQFYEYPHPAPSSPELKSPLGTPKCKTPVEGKMSDAILDRLSTLLMSGCSIQLACMEVHVFLCFRLFPLHVFYFVCSQYFQVGLARTTFYRWLERIRSMQSDSRWANASESYRMFVSTTVIAENSPSLVFLFFFTPAPRFYRAVASSCNIKEESEGFRSPVASPVKSFTYADGSCPGSPTLARDLSTQASTLPGITPTNFSNIPNRLRRHFLHLMHTIIKKFFA